VDLSRVNANDPAKTVLVASDVHLGSISTEQQEAFLTWLNQARDAASQIILNGDLFDFWFEYVWGHTAGHDDGLKLLKSIVDDGVRVMLMGGNHDWWGGRYLRDEIGVEYLQEPVVRDLAGLNTFVAHGDGLGRGDLAYRLLKLFLHGRVTRWAFAGLPPAVGDLIARGVSETEDRWTEPGSVELDRAASLREWAVAQMKARSELDLVLLGHTHVPELVSIAEGRWYINSGDWVYHRSYVVLREGQQPRLEEWDGSIK
jgi:UDP-2,3-diacylglucosamine hydrolase